MGTRSCTGALPYRRLALAEPMHELAADHARAATRERDHLERAHHELCSALTILRSNVALVRVELQEEKDPASRASVQRHLSELDGAVDRLLGLAVQMRAWHGESGLDARDHE